MFRRSSFELSYSSLSSPIAVTCLTYSRVAHAFQVEVISEVVLMGAGQHHITAWVNGAASSLVAGHPLVPKNLSGHLLRGMARPGRFELPTLCLEGRRSIQLSYGRVACSHSKTFMARFGSILA